MTGVCIVPTQGDVTAPHSTFQYVLLPLHLINGVLRAPLERRVRLRYQAGYTHSHSRPYTHSAADLSNPRCQLCNAFDIFIRLSGKADHEIKFDSFPTVLLEAARAGLPVVATDLGGSVEIVAHEQTGFLFSPAKAEDGLRWLQLLVQSPELRSSMGRAARTRFVAEFGVERMVAQYADCWSMQQAADQPRSL